MAFFRRKWLGLLVLLCCAPSAFGSFKSRKIGPLEVERVEWDSLDIINHQDSRFARLLLQSPEETNRSEWKPEEKSEWKSEKKEELRSEENERWKVKDTREEWKPDGKHEEVIDEEHKGAWKQEGKTEEWKPDVKHEEVVVEQSMKDWKSEEKKEEVKVEEQKEESKFVENHSELQVEDHKEEWKPEEKHEEVHAEESSEGEEWKHDVPQEGWDAKSEELQADLKLESKPEEGTVEQKLQENPPVVQREEKLELQFDKEESKIEDKSEFTSQKSITRELPGTNLLDNAGDVEQKQLEERNKGLVTLNDHQEQLQHDQELKDREQLAKHIQDLHQEKLSQHDQELKDREQLAKHIQDLHQEKLSQHDQELKDREQLAKHIQDLHQEKLSQHDHELKDREQLAKHIQDLHQEQLSQHDQELEDREQLAKHIQDLHQQQLSEHDQELEDREQLSKHIQGLHQERNPIDPNEEHLSLHQGQEYNLIDHNEEHLPIHYGQEEPGNHATQDDWTNWERNEVLRPTDKKMEWSHEKRKFVEVNEGDDPSFEGGEGVGRESHLVEDNEEIDVSHMNAEHDLEISGGIDTFASQDKQSRFVVKEENKQVTEDVGKDSVMQRSAVEDRNAGNQNPSIVSSLAAEAAVLRGNVRGNTQSSEMFQSKHQGASKDDPDHLVKKINVFSVQTKTHFVKVNQDLASTITPFLGNRHAPAVASVISYCLLLLPLALIFFVCEQVREFLTLQKAILFANIYLAVHFELLLVAALGLGSEPMEIFHEFSTSSYLVLQLVQAFGYILYLTLQTADLTLAYAEGTAIAKSTSTVQIVVASVIGVHYYITVFLKATQGVAPTTSWKAYAFYSIAFMTLCLLGRIHRGKKQYHSVGNETTDKKN
ncbi:uncharacterized protein [Physcomitrium patens]|uniref:Uncharacterized protein n=1 Tax=Physcomitrium patens TaxID=3218 RepID=A0A2K1K7S3_PHYPA|nr:trichohyalin-like [Physcomitrium patens]XP_024383532.1 trichohyalin-like [Physcomitrium patens]PNR49830.1 hypothetical protein PHYPA_011726 [Physcomitrium patens]|eukprot:XP_024383531.1 trichohyalin-like [Physcomitrella patens]